MPESFGQRLGRLRALHGWTQQALADRLALSRVAISHFEMGLATPSERTVILLAGLFRLEPHELVANTFYPEGKSLRLPSVAPRYSEVEHQLALCARDLAWCERLPSARAETLLHWQTSLEQLQHRCVDLHERQLIRAMLAQLC
ncbi:helix-turn-helix transcriptional regulator [Herpetosiphon geysericola]|uniref:helix-turn-helix transcriptional regulator n=1 Tax=Herpetosiphon geysericola TaxID=70996 RepID=UPI0006C8F885|nr:helix-turn-helix transcriptional regulator [Herpetosiphon geysericola]